MTTRRKFLQGSIATLGVGVVARAVQALPGPFDKDGLLPRYPDGRTHRVDVYFDGRDALLAIAVDGRLYPLPGWGSAQVDHAMTLRQGALAVRRTAGGDVLEVVPVAEGHQTRYYWYVRDPRTRAPLHVVSWEIEKGRYTLLADGHPVF